MDIEQYIVDFKYNDELLENFKKHLNKDANAILKAVYGEDYDNYCDGLMQNLRALIEKFFEEGSNTQESKPKFTAKNFIDFSNKFADEAKFEKVELNGNKDWATENNAVKAVKVLLVQLLSLPESASSYFNLGDRLNNLMTDDGKSAVLIFELSTIKYPKRNWPFYKLGKLLIKISNNKEKLKKLQQILISSEAGGIGDKEQASGYAIVQTVQKQINDKLNDVKNAFPVIDGSINDKSAFTSDFKMKVNNYLNNFDLNKVVKDTAETDITDITALFRDNKLHQLAQQVKEDQVNIVKNVFKLIYLVALFRANQVVTKGTKKVYYQYTSEATLKSMMALDRPENLKTTNIKVRLYNISGMNDPFEGKYAYNLLNYQPSEEATFIPSDTYIGSFIQEKTESLAMWKMYGDDFKGVRLGFKIKKSTPSTDGPEEDQPIQSELYKIAYLNTNYYKNVEKEIPSDEIKHDNEDGINSIFTEIQKIVSWLTKPIMHDEKNKIADTVTSILISELEKIRYLIKDPIYSNEKEYRLMVRINSAILKEEEVVTKKDAKDKHETEPTDVLLFDKGNPRLYYEFGDTELSSIIFGNSFNKAYQWLPFLSIKMPELMANNQITSSELEGRYR